MINTLIKTFQIDISYKVNSFIYAFKKLPIIEDLFENDSYDNKLVKIVVGIIQIIVSILKLSIKKGLYFYFIYLFTTILNPTKEFFFHIYFSLTILGMFINNNLLRTSTKKYLSLILFNMDSNKYLKSNLISNIIINLFFNYIFLFLILNNFYYATILTLFTINARLIGESLNIIFYKKYKYTWNSNNKIFIPIILLLLLVILLPIINILIPWNIILIITGLSVILGIASIVYLFNIKDYKLIYKKISSNKLVINKDEQDAYIKQSMKDNDIIIDSSIINKKEGYDLFNTIFFKRHKEILLRSAKKYSIYAAIIYIVLIFIMLKFPNYNKSIAELLHLRLSIFIVIMFFINRGHLLTRAMFYNCDHAMLNYSFYKEPKVILELFKKRLLTTIKVNLLPALVIGLGNITLLLISKNTYSTITIITTFIFIISLSLLYSVHYLVIYYLIQPYNVNMKTKKLSYTLITLLTYYLTYRLSNLIISSTILSVAGIIFTLIYVVISLILVYKISPKTFKLN